MNKIRFMLTAIFLASFFLLADWPDPWYTVQDRERIIEDSTGWKIAQKGESKNREECIGGWSSPGLIDSCDNVRSTGLLFPSNCTNWLRATDFGFTTEDIPEGATVNGIEVKIKCNSNSPDSNWVLEDFIYLRKPSGQVGDNKADETFWIYYNEGSVWEDKIKGGPSDDWNASLTASNIRNNNFGIDVSIRNIHSGFARGYVDCIRIRIFYSVVL